MSLAHRTQLIQALARVETHAPATALVRFVDLLESFFVPVVSEIPAGDINGVNMIYTTANDFSAIWVWLNGLRMKAGSDYNVTGANTFQFTYAPQTGDTLLVDYFS